MGTDNTLLLHPAEALIPYGALGAAVWMAWEALADMVECVPNKIRIAIKNSIFHKTSSFAFCMQKACVYRYL